MNLSDLEGIGPVRLETLRAVGIVSLRDLLFTLPIRYEDHYTEFPCSVKTPGMILVNGVFQDSLKTAYFHGISRVTGTICDKSGKLPVISWQSDYYLNWQARNGADNAFNAGVGVLNGAIGAVSRASSAETQLGASVAAVQGGLQIASVIQDAIHEDRVASLVPEQAMGNTNAGDINYAMRKTGFTFQRMSIRAEYARMIDGYFSAYGYKVNEFKIPQFSSRRYWNYIRTINVNITGDIPQEDMDEIKSYFNTGITFWHDSSKYLDYSQNNAIV